MQETISNTSRPLGRVLTILQEKGGCGKSSAIFNISYCLSEKNKVLVIDLDGQAADITYYYLGNKVNDRGDIKTILDCIRKGATTSEVIIPIARNLDLIPANVDVVNIAPTDKISSFRKIVEELRTQYDYILIDVSPSPNMSHMYCLAVCKYIIPIVNPDVASPKALTSLCESVADSKTYAKPDAEYLGIIMNMYDGRTNLAKTISAQVERIADMLGTCMFRTSISQSVALKEHIIEHKSIFDYAPSSKSAKEYKALVNEILERINDLQEEEEAR